MAESDNRKEEEKIAHNITQSIMPERVETLLEKRRRETRAAQEADLKKRGINVINNLDTATEASKTQDIKAQLNNSKSKEQEAKDDKAQRLKEYAAEKRMLETLKNRYAGRVKVDAQILSEQQALAKEKIEDKKRTNRTQEIAKLKEKYKNIEQGNTDMSVKYSFTKAKNNTVLTDKADPTTLSPQNKVINEIAQKYAVYHKQLDKVINRIRSNSPVSYEGSGSKTPPETKTNVASLSKTKTGRTL